MVDDLRALRKEAAKAPPSPYRDGYLDALREAIEIAEEADE